MRFYCLTEKKYVDVPDTKVKYETIKGRGGNRKMAKALCPKGHKLSKFVKG